MNLSFGSPFLSIQSFPTVDIPSFTLITGVNGSGKTHLLRAIKGGQVKADLAPNPNDDIRFFDWTSLVPNDTGEYQVAAVYEDRDQLLQWGYDQRQEQRDAIHAWASKNSLVGKGRGTTSSLLRLSREGLGQLIVDPNEADTAWQQMQEIAMPAIKQMKRKYRNDPAMTEKFNELHERFGCGLLALEMRDFDDAPFGWGQVDVFQQSFAQLFTR